jgi:hypothetical protein
MQGKEAPLFWLAAELLGKSLNQGGRVMIRMEPDIAGTVGRKLIVRVELTPVVSLELT